MAAKQCSRCHTTKSVEEFGLRSDGRRQSHCVLCKREYQKKHYTANKRRYIDRANKNKARYRRLGRQFLQEYCKTHPCVDCGETDYVVLEFDHRDGVEKTKEISMMVSNATSIDKIKRELEKCEVRCCNCHRRRTAKQLGWYEND